MAKEKLESSIHQRMTNCLADLASVDRPDTDFAELVWENGHILMQGQSNKTRKNSPIANTGVPHQEKEEEPAPPTLKTAHSILNVFSSSEPSSRHMGLGQDDELAHWLNYPLDDYSSEIFSDFSHNAFSTTVPVLKNFSYGGVNSEQGNVSKLVREGPGLNRTRGSQQCSSPHLQQCQTSLPSHRSKVPDSTACNSNSAQQAHCGNSNQNQPSTTGLPSTTIQQQEPEPTRPPAQPSNNTGFMNFSHFLRPTTFAKTNRQSVDVAPGSSSLSRDRLGTNDKVYVMSCSNPIQSTVIDSVNGSRSSTGYESKPNSLAAKVDAKPSLGKPPKEPFSIERPQMGCREDALGKRKSPDQAFVQTSSFAASTAIGGPDNEKYVEPVVASSVCSGNSVRGGSNNLKHPFKRKSRDTEESDYPSEDVEEESVGVRKPATARGGTSIKRSRAAEVHNLSERKRRDRINEKMRALQELIPNCNKVDKASMLDEAIEYLKTLQLQVQIMSMGTGLFMPPMMLANGMQHLSAPHLPPFSPMNAGMGMGMGFGMGMLDMSGGSSGCPLIQMPPMHGAQFSYPPISGPSSLPMMAGSSLHMFGPPTQGIPMSMPRAPFIPLSGGSSTQPALLPVVPGVATRREVPNLAVPLSSKDPTENINAQLPNRNVECSQNQIPAQVTKEGVEQSPVVQRHDHPPQ